MGFFDEFQDSSGLSFIKKEEKNVLIQDATDLAIVAVKRVTTNFDGHPGEQYVIVFDLDGETRALGFQIGNVESRDRMLAQMQDYLANSDEAEPVVVRLVKKGRSVLIKDANAVE